MELNHRDKKPPRDDPRRGRIVLLPTLFFAAVLGFIVAQASLAMLMRGWRIPLPDPAAVPPPGLAIDGGAGLGVVLLGMILRLLFGIFVLLLLLVLCVCCGCGGGKESGLLRLLATLMPGLTAGLRTGARGFDVSADAAHAAIDPLRQTGAALRDTLGPALKQIQVPDAGLQTTLLWDALHDAHLVPSHRPGAFDNIYVITNAQLGTSNPFDGPDSLGDQVTAAGSQLYADGDRAVTLEADLRLAAGGLRAAATALDGQP